MMVSQRLHVVKGYLPCREAYLRKESEDRKQPVLIDDVLVNLAVLSLQPDDALVFMADKAISLDIQTRIVEAVKQWLPGHEVLVLDCGIKLGVVRQTVGDGE